MAIGDEVRRNLDRDQEPARRRAAEYPVLDAAYREARTDALAAFAETLDALREFRVPPRPAGVREGNGSFLDHPGGWVLLGDGDLVLGTEGTLYVRGPVRQVRFGRRRTNAWSHNAISLAEHLGQWNPVGFYECSVTGDGSAPSGSRFVWVHHGLAHGGAWHIDFGSTWSSDYEQVFSGLGVRRLRGMLTQAVTRLARNPNSLD